MLLSFQSLWLGRRRFLRALLLSARLPSVPAPGRLLGWGLAWVPESRGALRGCHQEALRGALDPGREPPDRHVPLVLCVLHSDICLGRPRGPTTATLTSPETQVQLVSTLAANSRDVFALCPHKARFPAGQGEDSGSRAADPDSAVRPAARAPCGVGGTRPTTASEGQGANLSLRMGTFSSRESQDQIGF